MTNLTTLPLQIINIYNDYKEFIKTNEPNSYNKEWFCQGWIRDYRNQNDNTFINLFDGSTSDVLQIVCTKDNIKNYDSLENLRGSCVKVCGSIIKSPAKGQEIEMLCKSIDIIGLCTDKNSIILAKNAQLETLRNYQHLRTRFRSYYYIYKIRSCLLKHIHQFFHNNNFFNLDPNVITTSDCEGAGEAFTITTINALNIKEENDIYKNDFFEKQAFLTVSSQLQLEALASGLSRVYTLNPSFRAEKSKTKRHLACFTHLEWEIAFIDLKQLMDFSELLLKFVIKNTLDECSKEYSELNKFTSVGIIDKLNNIINNEFERISYDNAIELIEINKKNILKKYSKEITIKDIPKWGEDLGSYCEKYICDVIYSKPVFVYNYPKEFKSFYMKINSDKKTVQGCDLLCPELGELIGSSIREESYDKLIDEMNRRNMNISKLNWYVELRKLGTFPHGGAGLGFDRLVNLCTLINGNIRDVVPFPVAFQDCNY